MNRLDNAFTFLAALPGRLEASAVDWLARLPPWLCRALHWVSWEAGLWRDTLIVWEARQKRKREDFVTLEELQKHIEENEHHIWCNWYMSPRQGCKLCERLYAEYPMEGRTSSEMMAHYFPDAIVRPGTGPREEENE